MNATARKPRQPGLFRQFLATATAALVAWVDDHVSRRTQLAADEYLRGYADGYVDGSSDGCSCRGDDK